jgi:arginase
MARGESAIVLGGDCTVELGTVAGALRDGSSVGLVYIDLDVDLNPPAASDGALDWTVSAHLLDLPGAAPELSDVGPRRPMLAADQLLFLGADNITASERPIIETLALECVRLAEVRADPAAAGRRAADWGQRFDRLLVHLDIDVLEYTSFPIAENVRREPGLTLDQLARTLTPLLRAPNGRALTICEVNPDHAPDERATFAALIPALFGAFLDR